MRGLGPSHSSLIDAMSSTAYVMYCEQFVHTVQCTTHWMLSNAPLDTTHKDAESDGTCEHVSVLVTATSMWSLDGRLMVARTRICTDRISTDAHLPHTTCTHRSCTPLEQPRETFEPVDSQG